VAPCSNSGISFLLESRPSRELRFVQPASPSPTACGFTNDRPGGAQDGSRGLSKAIPPECRPKSTPNPGRGSRSTWIGNRHTNMTLTPGKNDQTTPIRAHGGPSRGRFRTIAGHHGTAIGRAPPVISWSRAFWNPVRGSCAGGAGFRGYRCAEPPATL